ncbi:MAG: single-stranded DNA-binding protein [Bdellovibrionota bacterium]
MNGINRVTIVGRIGTDLELKLAKSGKPYVNMSVATHFSKPNGNGEREPVTTWHKVKAFGKTAERCSSWLTKGSSVAIEGYLSRYAIEKDDGTKQYSVDIIAQQVEFIDRRRETSPAGALGDFEPSANAAAP